MFSIIQNLVLGISLAAPIGPSTIAIIQRGLKYGAFQAFLVTLGVALADLIHLSIVYFGLSSFINLIILRRLLGLLGLIVLTYFGYKSIKEGSKKIDFKINEVKKTKNAFVTGFLINISNPIAILWWIGVFGSSLSASITQASKVYILLSTLVIIAGIILWFTFMSICLHFGRKLINEKSMRYISIIGGIMLILFGLYFGYNNIFY